MLGSRLLLSVAIAIGLIACNALSGSSDLSVCDGLACGGDAGSASKDAQGANPDGSAPTGPCSDEGARTCDGRTLKTCAAGAFTTSLCAEACVGGVCVAYPSCRALPTNVCGADKTSCCETKTVPGGTFDRRNENAYPATIGAFDLESYEVTVGRFRSFVNAGAGTAMMAPSGGAGAHPRIPGSGWQSTWDSLLPSSSDSLREALDGSTWTDAPGANEVRPITNVSWHVAFAFCAWDGGRLPTLAERGFAAAGGEQQRRYPWSSPPDDDTITQSHAAHECGYTAPTLTCPPRICSVGGASPCDLTSCAVLGGMCSTPPCFGCDADKDIAPVGALPQGRGRYGHFDLGGNASELVLDAFNRKVDSENRLPTPCIDCAQLMGPTPTANGPGGSADFRLRYVGGAWDDDASSLSTSEQLSARWDEVSIRRGFRCARD